VLGNDEKKGHLLHCDRTAGIPVADVACEGCAAATHSITSVRILSKEVAHVRDEGHLQDTSRARCGEQVWALAMVQGVTGYIENGSI